MPKAAVYCRISADTQGTGLGVARQQEDCVALCDQRGYDVYKVYVDNDRSAFDGKHRPEFERMLADAEDGRFTVIVAWHDDRLWRNVVEQQMVFDLASRVGVTSIVANGRDYNPTSGDDLVVSGVQALFAQRESLDKRRRIRRKHRELATAGKDGGGGNRPFGFEPDRVTVRESEAEHIRDAAERLLAGESRGSVVRAWNEQGITTSLGNEWRLSVFRNMMSSGRIAGLRYHHGDLVATAQWPAIITVDQHERLRALFARAAGQRAPGEYLLSGLLQCSKCGAGMVGHRRRGYRNYKCSLCRGTASVAEPLEAHVRDVVLAALAGDGLARVLSKMSEQSEAETRLVDRIGQLEEALAELVRDYYVARGTTRQAMDEARAELEGRLAAARRDLERTSSAGLLVEALASPDELGQMWAARGAGWRRALLDVVLERVVLLPKGGGRVFDPRRVEFGWRA